MIQSIIFQTVPMVNMKLIQHVFVSIVVKAPHENGYDLRSQSQQSHTLTRGQYIILV